MQFMFAPTARGRSGFTLVEVLIISPLIILVVAVIVATMVNMTGSALQTRERNNLAYGVQEGLNQIESDVRLSRRVVLDTGALPAGQGSDSNFSGTAAFASGSNVLVLEQLSTSKNPFDPERTLLYYNSPYNCSNSLRHLNPTLRHQVIFFVDDNTLKRRTVVSFTDNTVCDSETLGATLDSVNSEGIWQRNSCKFTDTDRCFTLDAIIASNVESVNFAYYNSSSDDTPASPGPNTVSIRATINGVRTVAGQDVTHTSALRASRIE